MAYVTIRALKSGPFEVSGGANYSITKVKNTRKRSSLPFTSVAAVSLRTSPSAMAAIQTRHSMRRKPPVSLVPWP